ncbi:CDP-diacylglycerol--glycerol-3-phosphate 3-phosphatidyltransferase/cardiolipin synthase [Pseudochelatococcus lubricantis]|uniref:CDP-diacylglycerol--glycerol-3-phosphate 3-phosphatidyltransferase n=1 Tax=Pseudochelatococcus lubricantis TaxID=1538102 RepID=A0ABX0V0N3_9HYPH|nr:CDP-diacylglycerol--glycerol-3-phosphate 3-phosphatidyltransferase [Pseudochelatococcus lubricantis]NIJ58542.1 CDP-diacylglycerol--glycerol-3-phosphate 3-phosphatidyltransferase/cardiolipin synthase [Pseudochelatococcus lubricantis]
MSTPPLNSSASSPASGPKRPSSAMNLPNLLTYGRILAVPAVVVCLFWPNEREMRWVALAIFVLAAVTDYLDGYLARAWSQQSALGRMLDPIADKLLVAASLLMLVADGTIKSWSLWAALIILCREILVSGLREFLADLRVSVPVTKVAKWKTAAQLVALSFLIAGQAGEAVLPGTLRIGIALLWISAVLTLYTGWDYLNHGVRHILAQDERSRG